MAAAEYRKLVVIVWLVTAAAMGAFWGPKAWSGSTWDSDDFMRLAQVRDLLAGQPWNDLTQYRLNPPAGTLMHWSRLPDVALALVTLALSPLLGESAILAGAMLVPPLYFLLFLAVFAAAARLMLGRARSPVALLVAIGGSLGTAQFLPGRVDHHGLQLVTVMAALVLLLYGLASVRWSKAIAWAGAPFALSIWIGVENLPFIAAWFGVLGLAWCQAGGRLARHGAMAGALGAAIGVAILLIAQPRTLWLSAACDAFSLMPIAMLALIGLGFAGMALVGERVRSPWSRLAVACACGTAAGIAFVLAFPTCLHGGLEALDPVVRLRWLGHVTEAMSWTEQLASAPFRAAMSIWTPLLALAYCIWRVARSARRGRVLWGTLAVLALATSALVLWQVRTASIAQTVALVPLSGLVADVLAYLRRRQARWVRYASASLLLYMCSLLFWPSLQAAAGALAARQRGAPAIAELTIVPCSRAGTLAPLRGSAPALVLSYIDIGAMILFRTPHEVLAAPYHRNNEGLRTAIDLFSATDDRWIERRMKDLGVVWVVTCPGPEEATVYRTGQRSGLAERLSSGRVPDYLEEVADPERSGMRFYRVRTGV